MAGLPCTVQILGCQAREAVLPLPSLASSDPLSSIAGLPQPRHALCCQDGKINFLFNGWTPKCQPYSGVTGHVFVSPLSWLVSPGLALLLSSRPRNLHPLFHGWPLQVSLGPDVSDWVSCALSTTAGLLRPRKLLGCQGNEEEPLFLSWPPQEWPGHVVPVWGSCAHKSMAPRMMKLLPLFYVCPPLCRPDPCDHASEAVAPLSQLAFPGLATP